MDSVIGALAAGAGLGESVCYFATASVSLSLSASLQATLRDPSVLQAITHNNDINKVFSSFGRRDQDSYVDHLASLLVKKLEDIDNICLDQEVTNNDKGGLVRASLSALRLLNVWFRFIDAKFPQHVQNTSSFDGFELNVILGVSPARVLLAPSILSPHVRGNAFLSSAWSKAGVSTFDLLLLHLGDNDTSMVERILAAHTFDILSTFLRLGRIALSNEGSFMFRKITHSTLFGKILGQQLEKTHSLLAKPEFSISDKMDVSVVLRFLLLLLAVTNRLSSCVQR